MTVIAATFSTHAEVQAAARALTNQALIVADKKAEIVSEAPPLPYDTAALLEDATTRLGWNAGQVMRVAQRLFEGIELAGTHTGLITYHRTDSHQVAPEALGSARTVIIRLYGKGALPPVLAVPPSGGNLPTTWWQRLLRRPANQLAQQSHEAIRPTDPARLPDGLAKALDEDTLALYRLIWERFIASQMRAARYRVTTVEFEPILSNSEKLDKERSGQSGRHRTI